MKTTKLMSGTLLVLAVAWLMTPIIHSARHLCPVRPTGVHEAAAMPQWARRYGVNCDMCHTTVPALTKVGYHFRAAGFRMPDEIGKDAKFANISDLYAARIREEFDISGAATDGTAANAMVAPSNKFVFNELTFYPITGAFGKWWAAESEITIPESGGKPELENAYIRATIPINADAYVTARAGLFHPFEGYGASDRQISNIRPFFQSTGVGPFGTGLGTNVAKQDQEGLELGGTWKDSRLTMAIVNGYDSTKNAANEGETDNNRDFLFFFNQFIGDKAAVSAEYLTGKSPYGYAGAGNTWTNNYQKGALYANYKVLDDKFDLMAGYNLNKDHMMDAVTQNGSGSFNSQGWFLRAQSKFNDRLTGALAYDTLDPNTHVGFDRISAMTATLAVPLDNVKFLLDYQAKRTQKAAGHDRTDNMLRAEWMVIF